MGSRAVDLHDQLAAMAYGVHCIAIPPRPRAKLAYRSPEICMSHLTLQEVIERINKANAPVKDRRTNDKRVEDQPHRPEFYIPRMKRLANLMFSG